MAKKDEAAIKLWSEFSQNYKTEAIALAESVKLLNKYSKNANLNKHIKFQIYLLKNEWIQKHEQYLTKCSVCAISGHSDNFKQLFAYTFRIDGKIFGFHTYLRLKQSTKVHFAMHSSSKELSKAHGNNKKLSKEEKRLLQKGLLLFMHMVESKLQTVEVIKIDDSNISDSS